MSVVSPVRPPSDVAPLAFARALTAALQGADMRQVDLAGALGVTQAAVSKWVLGQRVPDPPVVFSIEELLDCPPGFLSRHLGYLPIAERAAFPCSVAHAIQSDEDLTPMGKYAVMAVYKSHRRSRKAP